MITIFTASNPTGETLTPTPQDFEVRMSDLEGEGSKRDASYGILQRTVFRRDVRQIPLKFPAMTTAKMATLLQQLKSARQSFSLNEVLSMVSYRAIGNKTIFATVNNSSKYRFCAGDTFTIAGATANTALNGTWKILKVISGTQFQFQITTVVSTGTYTTGLGTTTLTTKDADFIRIKYPDPEDNTLDMVRMFYRTDAVAPLYNKQLGLYNPLSFDLIER